MRSLLEEPEVLVIGAGQGPAGSIIHRMFVSAQRVRAEFKRFTSLNQPLNGTKKYKLEQMQWLLNIKLYFRKLVDYI